MSIFNVFKPIKRAVRRYLRKRMMPMTVDEAESKRELLSKLYLICAFATFTLVVSEFYKDDKLESSKIKVPRGEALVDKLHIDNNVRIMHFEGFKKVDDYYYKRKKSSEEENIENPNSN